MKAIGYNCPNLIKSKKLYVFYCPTYLALICKVISYAYLEYLYFRFRVVDISQAALQTPIQF